MWTLKVAENDLHIHDRKIVREMDFRMMSIV